MNSLNLLPRKTIAERFFVVLLFLIVLITLSTASVILYLYDDMKSEAREGQQQLDKINKELAELHQARKNHEKPLAAMYTKYNDAIIGLQDATYDWHVAMDVFAGALPQQARVKTLNARSDDDAMIMDAALEFTQLSAISTFAERLMADTHVKQVDISQVIRNDMLRSPPLSNAYAEQAEVEAEEYVLIYEVYLLVMFER